MVRYYGILKNVLKPVVYEYSENTKTVSIIIGKDIKIVYRINVDSATVVTEQYVTNVSTEPIVVTAPDGSTIVVDPLSQLLDFISTILKDCIWFNM